MTRTRDKNGQDTDNTPIFPSVKNNPHAKQQEKTRKNNPPRQATSACIENNPHAKQQERTRKNNPPRQATSACTD